MATGNGRSGPELGPEDAVIALDMETGTIRWVPQIARDGDLKRENERQARENEELRERLTDRAKKLVEAEKQIVDLERQLGLRDRNSTTSWKPPSFDELAGEQRERGGGRKKSYRKRGGQPGHPGHWRKPVSEERVSRVVDVLSEQCSHCKQPLLGHWKAWGASLAASPESVLDSG